LHSMFGADAASLRAVGHQRPADIEGHLPGLQQRFARWRYPARGNPNISISWAGPRSAT